MSIFLSFFGIPDLKLCFVLFTVFLTEHPIPQTFTVYQDIATSLLTEFLTFSGHDSVNDHTGDCFIYPRTV